MRGLAAQRGSARACEGRGGGGGGRHSGVPHHAFVMPPSPMAQGLALAWLASLYRINRYTFKVSWLTLPALRRPQSGQCGPARRRAPRAPRRRRVCHWHCHVPVHRPHPAKCEQCDVRGLCVRTRRPRAPRVLVSGRAARGAPAACAIGEEIDPRRSVSITAACMAQGGLACPDPARALEGTHPSICSLRGGRPWCVGIAATHLCPLL